MDSLDRVKQDILHVCRRIYEREMVASNDGNVSVKVGPDRVICTPTGMSKGFLQPEDLVITDLEGNPLNEGSRKVTSEIRIYLRIFQLRPDISAAVHAHPLTATALAVAGRTVDSEVLPESVLSLGKVPLVPYGTPGTEELAGQIAKYLPEHNVFLLANHGALALGRNVIQAYHRMECLEHTAKILFLAESMGRVNRLTREQIARIYEVHGKREA
ncbi:MAG TPA: class II aldolase/adducin family protein [archaeon]|nr:class II aldolase/adducin family protein [archaeon]